MKKCYHFPTWKEKENVAIFLDEEALLTRSSEKHTYKMLEEFRKTTPGDPNLLQICLTTGSSMYGDYIIVENHKAERYFREYSLFLQNKINEWEDIKSELEF